jgi:hypothetical protein
MNGVVVSLAWSMKDIEQIMKGPINGLGASEDFCMRSKLMGCEKLEDILGTPVHVWMKNEAFSYKWLSELVSLAKTHNLLYKLQARPGSIAC